MSPSNRNRFRLADTMVELARDVGAVARAVKPHDRDLADQMLRAWTSANHNLNEGRHQRGNKSTNRIDDAMGSARETRTAIMLAEAYGHVPATKALPLAHRIDGCVAQLYRLINKRR
jgi:four helix bundle protein